MLKRTFWQLKKRAIIYILYYSSSPLRFRVLQGSCRCSTDGSVREDLLVFLIVQESGAGESDTSAILSETPSWIINYSTGINCKVNWLVWLSEAAVFLYVSAWMLCPNVRLSAALWLYRTCTSVHINWFCLYGCFYLQLEIMNTKIFISHYLLFVKHNKLLI